MSMCFVFGSNLAGVHGAGAALFAKQYHGAIQYQGIGLQGNSYGIPTKDVRIQTLSLLTIERYINDFIRFAYLHPEMQFQVTQIGCGLAGYTPSNIAPMFKDAPNNCYFDKAWAPYLPHIAYYWNA